MERFAIKGANRAEMAEVDGEYPAGLEPLGGCDHGSVGEAKIEIRVSFEQRV